ncbi:MAG TPA: helix-turn-helix transcriptional regulator [Paenibacillus sp.]|jgi:DNA-binding Xre family transcriptional regulator
MTKKVRVTLDESLQRKGMTMNELSLKADVRRAAISELINGKRENINFRHIEQIAEVLKISDIREIITLVEEND